MSSELAYCSKTRSSSLPFIRGRLFDCLTHEGKISSCDESVKSLKNADNTTAWVRDGGHLEFKGNSNLPAEVPHGQQTLKLNPAQMPGTVAL